MPSLEELIQTWRKVFGQKPETKKTSSTPPDYVILTVCPACGAQIRVGVGKGRPALMFVRCIACGYAWEPKIVGEVPL